MKIKHFLLLVLLLPLTGCGLFSDPVPPYIIYTTYGNATDRAITVTTYKADHSTINRTFTIAPGDEYTYPPLHSGDVYDGGSAYISVSNGKYVFVQKYDDSFYPNYLFRYDFYQKTTTKTTIYYKYVFSDKDFDYSSGNNIEEVPQLK